MKTLAVLLLSLLVLIFADSLTTIELFPKYLDYGYLVLGIITALFVMIIIWGVQIQQSRKDITYTLTILFPLCVYLGILRIITLFSGNLRIFERCGWDVYYTDKSFGWTRVIDGAYKKFPIYVFRPENMFREQEITSYEVGVSPLGIYIPEDLCE